VPPGWNLRSRAKLSGGERAYDALGYGPPVILVHGTPGRSYVWRNVASKLADRFTVHVFDLLGFGESERREGLDVSIAAQARLLAELVERHGAWRSPPSRATTSGARSRSAPTCWSMSLSRISP
jgi:pimeloyl-ACP methyl ester carboxylesterase